MTSYKNFTKNKQNISELKQDEKGIICAIPNTKIFTIQSDSEYKLEDGIYCVGKEALDLVIEKLKL